MKKFLFPLFMAIVGFAISQAQQSLSQKENRVVTQLHGISLPECAAVTEFSNGWYAQGFSAFERDEKRRESVEYKIVELKKNFENVPVEDINRAFQNLFRFLDVKGTALEAEIFGAEGGPQSEEATHQRQLRVQDEILCDLDQELKFVMGDQIG